MSDKANPAGYIHHQHSKVISTIRHSVFGLEDGMVSTLGAITGIAIGARNNSIVILAGTVIIAVESISMAIGTYLSSKTSSEVDLRKLQEEKMQIKNDLSGEKLELQQMYLNDGWPKELAPQMAEAATRDQNLILKEMAYRELKLIPQKLDNSLLNGIFMYISYILGGLIPLMAYFFLSIPSALPVSIVATLAALFGLGIWTTKYTKQNWWKAGLKIVSLASIALIAGYAIGKIFEPG